jgi:tRNA/rRNA methyltransferase
MKRCRIVLVQTYYPGNIGAAARSMRNFGLDDLALVLPRARALDRQAMQMATHAEDILHRAREYGCLADAVADCTLVVGTSARVGSLMRRQTVGSPEAILPKMAAALARGEQTALVFGPEPTGLSNDEIAQCHYLLSIPTADARTSLNLAQAVAICAYELYRHGAGTEGREPAVVTSPPATQQELDRLFGRLRASLEKIHFLYGDKADTLMLAVRHLLTRAQLSVMETKLLHGLARQIDWYVEHHPSTGGPS